MKKVTFNVGANAVIQLGENLYKNVYGVLVEYITNSYDADASLVKILVNRDRKQIIINDDGTGMSHNELSSVFMNVGLNNRKKVNTTIKGRLVTGRKGFGKLACFGLFEGFKVETVKDNLKSILIIETSENEDGEFTYTANINNEPEHSEENNGTTIYLINNTQNIPDNNSLAISIAKRINLMYDENTDDPDGFNIQLEDITIDKTYRDELVINSDIKFKYSIPEDLKRFTKDKSIIKYITENNIHGVIIAREKTVRVKENKGVVLFARGKLCQEATYLDINPSNNYGYAHLYSEFYVDFIDNEAKDNIGTDRTALKETETTEELFEVIESLMKSYARLYDEDEKQRKIQAVADFKDDEKYKEITKSIDSVQNIDLKKELNNLFRMKIKDSITTSTVDTVGFENFEKVTNSIISTFSIASDQISKDEPKDNVITSYDYLIDHLRNKYDYNGNDGADIINSIFGQNSTTTEFTKLANCLVPQVKTDLKKSLRELGSSIVNIRNSIMHTNNRICINDNISIENSKRFLVMVDLFIELDNIFFQLNEQNN
jgi:hypothetical protein